MNTTEACIALNMLPTIGPVRLRKLLRVFETPEQVLAARGAALRAVEGIGPEVAEQIVGWESVVDLPAELARIRDFGAHVITAESPTYPRQLREIHAPPIVLYVWGELTERDQHAIGIIGSRRTTHYGIIEALSAGERRAGREDRERQRRGGLGVLDGSRTRSANLPDAQSDHQRLEPRHSGGGSWAE
jgi:DNA processing protein